MTTETASVRKPAARKQPVTPAIRSQYLSHGTLEAKDMRASRRFYEEFLGLEVVRHGAPAMLLRLASDFVVVCVEVGENARPLGVMNHWGIDVDSREDVDHAYAQAVKLKDEYGIKRVARPHDQHGVYSFYIEDLDSNWWEIQKAPPGIHERLYAEGDKVPMD